MGANLPHLPTARKGTCPVSDVAVRPAADADLAAIANVAIAAGQQDEWAGSNPVYVRHLMNHGRVVVAELDGEVAGFGAAQQVGAGPRAATMLCDLFVHPANHGRGCGRAMLADLWSGAARRMTFSSLHSNAIPLYTSFGADAWWPLLYLHGTADRLPASAGWTAEQVSADTVAGHELAWTGAGRTADHRAWAARPGGAPVIVSVGGEIMAAGTVAGSESQRGIEHLAISPAADDSTAAAAVVTVLAYLGTTGGATQVCLPAPHPAVRPLLAAGWRFDEFDVFMASEPGLLDPRRAVPSPGQA